MLSLACRAPKPTLPDVGSFDDILAEARQHTGGAAAQPAAGASPADQPAGGAGAAAEEQPEDAGAELRPAAAVGEADAGAGGMEGGADDDGDDLVIMDSDEDDDGGSGGLAEVRLVDLPSTSKKKRRMDFITQVKGAAMRGELCALAGCLSMQGWAGV